MIYDIWYMVYDIWYMVYGIWYMIFDIIWYGMIWYIYIHMYMYIAPENPVKCIVQYTWPVTSLVLFARYPPPGAPWQSLQSPVAAVDLATETSWRKVKPWALPICKHVGGSRNGGTPKWMVYNGKCNLHGWFGNTSPPFVETSMSTNAITLGMYAAQIECPCTCRRVDGREPSCTPVYHSTPLISESNLHLLSGFKPCINCVCPLRWSHGLKFWHIPLCCCCLHIQPTPSFSCRGTSLLLAKFRDCFLHKLQHEKYGV